MALAPYFDRAAAAASAVLRGASFAAIAELLGSKAPSIAFDSAAASSQEAVFTLELLTNLLGRFYPTLNTVPLGRPGEHVLACERRLHDIARSVNPQIDVSSISQASGDTVVVGETFCPGGVHVGSRGWQLRLSRKDAIGSGTSANPFGAGAAACAAAAELFRTMFRHALGSHVSDETAQSSWGDDGQWLSLLTYERGGLTARDPEILGRDIGEVVLVGAGAIGNGALWVLARSGVAGRLHVVDPEIVELSNLQRYVLTRFVHVGVSKVALAAEYLNDLQLLGPSTLTIRGCEVPFAAFAKQEHEGLLRTQTRFLLALDSARDRIAVQSALPYWIANAWTQPANIGVSRHYNFLADPCVSCLYLGRERQNEDQLYADALRADASELMEIRTRLFDGRAVGEPFVRRLAGRLAVPEDALLSFAQRPIRDLYREAICGGLVLKLGAYQDDAVEVPLAFQSAMAGIMLAVEAVADSLALRDVPLPCRTEIDLLRPLATHLNIPSAKHPSGGCICQDPIFVARYSRKFPVRSG